MQHVTSRRWHKHLEVLALRINGRLHAHLGEVFDHLPRRERHSDRPGNVSNIRREFLGRQVWCQFGAPIRTNDLHGLNNERLGRSVLAEHANHLIEGHIELGQISARTLNSGGERSKAERSE